MGDGLGDEMGWRKVPTLNRKVRDFRMRHLGMSYCGADARPDRRGHPSLCDRGGLRIEQKGRGTGV